MKVRNCLEIAYKKLRGECSRFLLGNFDSKFFLKYENCKKYLENKKQFILEWIYGAFRESIVLI